LINEQRYAHERSDSDQDDSQENNQMKQQAEIEGLRHELLMSKAKF
jgi:hypothetical protein